MDDLSCSHNYFFVKFTRQKEILNQSGYFVFFHLEFPISLSVEPVLLVKKEFSYEM